MTILSKIPNIHRYVFEGDFLVTAPQIGGEEQVLTSIAQELDDNVEQTERQGDDGDGDDDEILAQCQDWSACVT